MQGWVVDPAIFIKSRPRLVPLGWGVVQVEGRPAALVTVLRVAGLPTMTVEVALAVLERQNGWLLQLRDDIPGIVAPGAWGLFGGHLDPGETPDQAVRRELWEEITWRPSGPLPFWFRHANADRIAHVFRAPLPLPLASLQLREGQDMVVASLQELRRGRVWSPLLRQHRPLAPSLHCALAVLDQDSRPPSSTSGAGHQAGQQKAPPGRRSSSLSPPTGASEGPTPL